MSNGLASRPPDGAVQLPEGAVLSEADYRIIRNLVIGGALMFALLGAQGYTRGDAADSRLATVYSLVEDGTWYIDRPAGQEPNPFEQNTIDKVMVKGRLISSKPPVLSALMALEYLVLHGVFGWDLDVPGDANQIVRFMASTLSGLAYVLALVFFAKTLRFFVDDPLIRVLLLYALAFCTQLWGYATQINNHVPAAAMLVVALYFALGIGFGKLSPAPWRFGVFGLAGGLVFTLDMPGSIFVALAGLYLLVKHPARTLTAALAGAAVPLAFHFAVMYHVTGNLLPVQTRGEPYLYEASYWRNPQGIDALDEPKAVYLFHMTFGRCGLFSLYPILFAGVAGALRALIRPALPHRRLILAGAAAFGVMTLYYVLQTHNYGGEAYGFRWYIVAMPVLLLMGAPIFTTLRARWKWMFVGLVLGVSFYSAFECAKSPWGANREWTVRLFLGPSYGTPGK